MAGRLAQPARFIGRWGLSFHPCARACVEPARRDIGGNRKHALEQGGRGEEPAPPARPCPLPGSPSRSALGCGRQEVRSGLLDGAARSSRARSETLRCSCAAGSRRPARLSGPGIPQAVAATPPAACPQAVAASLSPAACPQASPACPRAAAATPCRLPRGPAAQQGACPGDSQSPCSAVGNRTVSQDGKQAWGLGEGWRHN